jgi:hypothetical protein
MGARERLAVEFTTMRTALVEVLLRYVTSSTGNHCGRSVPTLPTSAMAIGDCPSLRKLERAYELLGFI